MNHCVVYLVMKEEQLNRACEVGVHFRMQRSCMEAMVLDRPEDGEFLFEPRGGVLIVLV